MKYVSLFAGIGGFDLALNRAGHECVYVNEWDKYSVQTYEKNFSNQQVTKVEQDGEGRNGNSNQEGIDVHNRSITSLRHVDTRSITDVSAGDIPDHDILVGGFPCQAFSIAGKRRGFDETRGTLFFEIARILKAKHTRYFILENVKGLLSHDGGRTFKTIISTLVELGYDLQWQVLNSKNFGVPQNRERVFIIGHLRGQRRPKIFPFGEGSASNTNSNIIGGTLTSRYPASQREGSYPEETRDGKGKIRTLTPIECERLQGFPDNWTEGVSNAQRYKQLGNAVTVNVVEAIMSRFN